MTSVPYTRLQLHSELLSWSKFTWMLFLHDWSLSSAVSWDLTENMVALAVKMFVMNLTYANDVRRMGDQVIVIGNMRRLLEEVKSKLEACLVKACGREVALWFMEETVNNPTKQVTLVCIILSSSKLFGISKKVCHGQFYSS